MPLIIFAIFMTPIILLMPCHYFRRFIRTMRADARDAHSSFDVHLRQKERVMILCRSVC